MSIDQCCTQNCNGLICRWFSLTSSSCQLSVASLLLVVELQFKLPKFATLQIPGRVRQNLPSWLTVRTVRVGPAGRSAARPRRWLNHWPQASISKISTWSWYSISSSRPYIIDSDDIGYWVPWPWLNYNFNVKLPSWLGTPSHWQAWSETSTWQVQASCQWLRVSETQ